MYIAKAKTKLKDKMILEATKFKEARTKATIKHPYYKLNTLNDQKDYIGRLGELVFCEYLDYLRIPYKIEPTHHDGIGDDYDFIIGGEKWDVKTREKPNSGKDYIEDWCVLQERNIEHSRKTGCNNLFHIELDKGYAYMLGACHIDAYSLSNKKNRTGGKLWHTDIKKFYGII